MTEAERRERNKAFTEEESITFNMLNEETIEALKRGDISFPYEEMKRKVVNIPKDERWNMKQITSKLMQGILQGDSIPKISKSLYSVVGNNKVAATRTARTLTTQAENRGRIDSFKNLDGQGVVQEKVWIATPDSRTRQTHLDVDGERVDINDEFSNGLEYPADPAGDPSEVYNCRCAMRTEIIGFRRADGSISYVGYNRDQTMHAGQIAEERDERFNKKLEQMRKKAEAAKKRAIERQKAQSKKAIEKAKEILHGDEESYKKLKLKADNVFGVDHLDVSNLPNPLTESEIIDKLAGGDLTQGSCSSLAIAYCANKAGLDVTDFRGGDSMSMFSKNMNIPLVYKTADADIQEHMVKREAKDVAKLLKGIDENREYVLRTGRHAAVVRRTNDTVEYLEMQSPVRNGWRPMEWSIKSKWGESKYTVEDTLRERFGCRKTIDKDKYSGYIYERSCLLIPVDTVKPTEEFRDICGYINTEKSKQKKGAYGSAK